MLAAYSGLLAERLDVIVTKGKNNTMGDRLSLFVSLLSYKDKDMAFRKKALISER